MIYQFEGLKLSNSASVFVNFYTKKGKINDTNKDKVIYIAELEALKSKYGFIDDYHVNFAMSLLNIL